MTYVNYVYWFFIFLATVIQLALALPAPKDVYFLGGRYPGKLTLKIRMAELIQILVMTLFAEIVLTRSGLILDPRKNANRIAIWFVAGLFVLGSFVNSFFSNTREKRILGSVNNLTLALSGLNDLSLDLLKRRLVK